MNDVFSQVPDMVREALKEDIGSGDVTAALLPNDLMVEAEIISREPLLVCGQPWVNEVFKQVDPSVNIDWKVSEGEYLKTNASLCNLQGHARSILTAERTALNFLQTLSATATQTHRYVQHIKGTRACLLDTRKTIPGYRLAQKYAVLLGGGHNHRLGLYDAFLIKENHIKACGSIKNAIQMARKANHQLLLEVEVETMDELREALAAHPDRILLDNFSLDLLIQAVALNQTMKCKLEASGGITIENIADVAKTGVDYISVGEITKSIQAIDLSLLLREVK